MRIRRIKITLAYDGTNYVGWQIQKNGKSIQEMLERGLELLTSNPAKVIGAGRTDSGVHARGQVAHFDTDLESLPAERFYKALNTRLPQDIRVLSSSQVSERFHARFDATERVYRYYLSTGTVVSPFIFRYSHHLRREPDLSRLNTLCRPLLGVHDFTTFSAEREQGESKVREIYRASFYPKGRFIVFEISGSSFLWRMVRSLVGTLLELEEQGSPEGALLELLTARDRSLAGTTAPAKGLFLEKVEYGRENEKRDSRVLLGDP